MSSIDRLALKTKRGRPEGLPEICIETDRYDCFTLNTQTTPPWGTLSLSPILAFDRAS